jgi:protein-S-isoprenylcysteine O-methyltransferase Ste14
MERIAIPDAVELRVDQLEVLKVLYPWYKEEVFRRREQMMRLTAFASAFLVLLLVTMLAVPSRAHVGFTGELFAITGVALFSAIFAYLILQQRNRHRLAKQALIEIERVLGLYEEGFYLQDKPLYPPEWQTSWLRDKSVVVYLAVLTALTALVIAAVLVRP